MKRVLAGLAGAVALAGMSSMGMAQAPEKGERPPPNGKHNNPKRRQLPEPRRPTGRLLVRRQSVLLLPSAAARNRRLQLRLAHGRPPSASALNKGSPRTARAASRAARRKTSARRTRCGSARPSPPQRRLARSRSRRAPRRPDVAAKGEPRAQPVARIHATDQQRREVHRGLFRQGKVERITRNGLGIALAVGNHVPRRHRLHRFTPALIALAPLYAAYSYIVVDDTICVVDSSTYVIVDMIEGSIETAGPLPAPPLALALSPEQMRLIYASVPKDGVRTELRIRLALGAEIPRSVELLAFPDALIAQVPQIASLRYIVVENDVVIVDPATYGIAMVISEGAA